jgi:hypothetical protein
MLRSACDTGEHIGVVAAELLLTNEIDELFAPARLPNLFLAAKVLLAEI